MKSGAFVRRKYPKEIFSRSNAPDLEKKFLILSEINPNLELKV
jgi:hypothetical protein